MSKVDKRDRLKNNPFDYHTNHQNKTRITYLGKHIMTLGDKESYKLQKKVLGKNDFEVQLVLAKITGHFKH